MVRSAASESSRSAPRTVDRSRGDVAIIGAGPGGLATAMLLAAKGIKVTVYEAAPAIGGRTTRLSLDDGDDRYTFDTGPTFFLMPYVLDEIFAACGRRLMDYVNLTRLDPMYRLVMGRQGQSPITINCTQDVQAMSAQISREIDPHDGPAFAAFIADNRRKLTAFEPVLRKPFRSFLDLLDPKLLAALPHLGPTRSVYGDLTRRFKSEYTKLITSFQSKYLGMSPMKCPSLFTILPFIEYEYGVWHPQGGCNALMAGMARVCDELGVEIRCSEPVERIGFAGRRAESVTTSRGTFRHDHIVINADASYAIKNLIPASLRTGLFGWSDRKLDSMGYSCSTYMLYLGLNGKLNLPHHTIYISERYQQNLADISDNGVLSHDPSVYACNTAATDHTMAPDGKSALYVLVPTPNMRDGKIDWATQGPALRQQALARISTLAGRDIAPMIRAERIYTPETWRGMNINFGATFNLAHNLTQMLMLRPQHELAGVEHVWLAGGGTHPGSGLPVIFLSAQIAASKLAQRLGIADTLSPRTRSVIEAASHPGGLPAGPLVDLKPSGTAAAVG